MTITVNKKRGFTLVELMVALAVSAIILAVGIPSYRSLTVGNHLTTVSNRLVSSLKEARTEAIKRNAAVQFCGAAGSNGNGTLGSACADHAGGVFALEYNDGANVAQSVLSAIDTGAGSLHIKQLVALQYSGQGLAHRVGESAPYSGTVAIVCSDDIGSSNRLTISMVTGSILNTQTSSGGCP